MTARQEFRGSKAWAVAAIIALCVLVFDLHVDRFKLPANESSAVGRLRDLVLLQNQFRSQHGCFAAQLGDLPDVTSLDHAYTYTVLPQEWNARGCVTKYTVTASPASPHTKDRFFSLDENETLRVEPKRPPDVSSAILYSKTTNATTR